MRWLLHVGAACAPTMHELHSLYGCYCERYTTKFKVTLLFSRFREIEDPKLPLVFIVTEKNEKDILGQVTVPLCDLVSFRTNRPDKVPLQPHKKCTNPEGELVLEAYISASAMVNAPSICVTEAAAEGDDKKHSFQSSLKKLRDKVSKSPMLTRYDLKPKYSNCFYGYKVYCFNIS